MTTQARSTRPLGGTYWNIWRAVVGVLYLVAAGFNLFVTAPRHLEWFAENAWFSFLERFVADTVVPHAGLFMGALAVFEVGVGVLILSRGRSVDLGVVASVLWVLVLLPFLPVIPMGLTNLVLAAIQGVIALRRYDRTVWRPVANVLGPRAVPKPS